MQRVLSLFIVCGMLLISTPSFGGIIFYDDCENQWVTGKEWDVSNARGGNTVEVSSDRARAGNRSYKMKLMPFGTKGAETNVGLILRAIKNETGNANFKFKTEYWMGFSIYIPSDFRFPNDWGLLAQFHGIVEPCDAPNLNPNMAFYLNKNVSGFNIQIKSNADACQQKVYDRTPNWSAPFIKGGWNDIVMNFKFSYSGNDGFFKVWLNGEQVVNDIGPNCYNDAKAPYFVPTIYGHVDQMTVVYYDEFRVGDANSSYNEVAPGGGVAKLQAPNTLQIITFD